MLDCVSRNNQCLFQLNTDMFEGTRDIEGVNVYDFGNQLILLSWDNEQNFSVSLILIESIV